MTFTFRRIHTTAQIQRYRWKVIEKPKSKTTIELPCFGGEPCTYCDNIMVVTTVPKRLYVSNVYTYVLRTYISMDRVLAIFYGLDLLKAIYNWNTWCFTRYLHTAADWWICDMGGGWWVGVVVVVVVEGIPKRNEHGGEWVDRTENGTRRSSCMTRERDDDGS